MRPTYKLLPDFILPNLEKATYGRHLLWEDRGKGSFKVSRIHQSSDQWKDDCIAVYKEWSVRKRLWNSDDPKRVTKAKHRLITALRRNPVIEMLRKESAYYRFRLIDHSTSGDFFENNASDSNRMSVCTTDKDENEVVCQTDHPSKSSFAKTPQQGRKDAVVDNIESLIKNDDNYTKSHNFLTIESEQEISSKDLGLALLQSETTFETHHLTEEKSFMFSDKCCCEILLDSNFLCNQMCIWHGILP